jgi:hypothetical protein
VLSSIELVSHLITSKTLILAAILYDTEMWFLALIGREFLAQRSGQLSSANELCSVLQLSVL